MNAPLSRQQRRQLERAAAGVDHVTAEDRAWFEVHPERQYRVRRMAAAEIASAVALRALQPVSPGAARFTLVRKMTPNLRLRSFITGPAHKDGTEASEEIADALWRHYHKSSVRSCEHEDALSTIVADHDAASRGAPGDAA